MQEKQINVKTLAGISDQELHKLVEGLKAIKELNFYVDAQFLIKNTGKS